MKWEDTVWLSRLDSGGVWAEVWPKYTLVHDWFCYIAEVGCERKNGTALGRDAAKVAAEQAIEKMRREHKK